MPSNAPRCIILGGGGHARVLIDVLRASHAATIHGVLDMNQAVWGTTVLDVPIVGGDDCVPQMIREGVTHFVVGLGGVGDNAPRRRLFELGLKSHLTPLSVSHPSAVCSPAARIGYGSVLFPTAVVNAGAVLGVNVIVNSGAIVEHDCELGDHVHVATGARLASTVRVGAFAHIGAGATVRQCLSIGEGAVIGAGAVVVEDVAPWTVMVGVPARMLRQIQPSEVLA